MSHRERSHGLPQPKSDSGGHLTFLFLLSLLVILPVAAQAHLAVQSTVPAHGATGVSLDTDVTITFIEPIQPETFNGTIDGAPIVPTQIVVAPDSIVVTLDLGELEYGRTYEVVVDSTTLAFDAHPMLADYVFSFTIESSPGSKRPLTTIELPAGSIEAGQLATITGNASGFVWERDADNPLELVHWDENGNITGDSPMLHPAALYFPDGYDGYKFWLFYTPFPPAVHENPVIMRSNDGVNFTADGITNPLFTSNTQPPYDMQNICDPEAYYLGDTWMLFYELETPAATAATIGPWMHGGGYIGVAFSEGGVNWEPYGGPYTYDPGNPPTGFPPDGNPILFPESANWWEDSSDSKTGEMGVFFKDGQFHLWRSVLDDTGMHVTYDTASDPRGPWTKHEPVLTFTGGYGPHCDVVYDPERDIYLMSILRSPLHFYTAEDVTGPWTEHPQNPVFSPQEPWEGTACYRASYLRVDGQWYMYYCGDPTDWQIGLAREVSGVRQVEVSTDGGSTWLPASVQTDGSWSFGWVPPAEGEYTVQARAIDDFMSSDAAAVPATVGPGSGGPQGGYNCSEQTTLEPPAAPLLVVTNELNLDSFGCYLTEILRAEGLMEYQQAELSILMGAGDPLGHLMNYEVVILASTPLTAGEEQLMRDYVSGGGNLIAMRPDTGLVDLFGLSHAGIRPEQYLEFFAFDTSSGPGVGIVDASLQYHGEADNYSLNGAAALAYLWDDIDTPSTNPAVTLNSYGSGQAAAFTFDLAESIVLMRQGNPEWQDSEGDGLGGYRPLDMFTRTTGERYLSGYRTRIPQADEKQRFLANLILSLSPSPMPRMWYLPGQHKAVMINTGDGENLAGSSLEPPMNDIATYGGAFTTYMMEVGITSTSPAQEAAWRAAGHETGPHVYGGGPETYPALFSAYQNIVASLNSQFGHGARSARSHTIDWTGWSEMAEIEAHFGTGMDCNYYHYTPWLLGFGDGANGYLTGSGLPQRFSDETGVLLPIYQLLTEWPDEWFDDNGFGVTGTVQVIQEMFQAAEDLGYYSAFCNNIHAVRYNNVAGDITHDWANQIWAYCQTNGIPLWTAERLLDFSETRNDARFDNITWNGTNLAFDFSTTTAGEELTLMVPYSVGGQNIIELQIDAAPVAYQSEIIKGRTYALYTTTAAGAQVLAVYGVDSDPPVLSNVRAESITDVTAAILWDTDEPATSLVEYGTSPGDLNVSQSVPGYTSAHSVPLSGLTASTTYYYQVTSEDQAGNPPSVSSILDFTTASPRWTETTIADFEDGLLLQDVVVVGSGDGALRLAPSTGFLDHFEGTELDTTVAWELRNWGGGAAAATVGGSWVSMTEMSHIRTRDDFFQQSVEGLVELADGANAHFGFATTIQSGDGGIDDPHWMLFTARAGVIEARTRLNDGQGNAGGEINTLLPGILPGVPHHFEVVWKSDDTIEFWVDSYLETTHTRAFTENMRVYLSSNTGQLARADYVSVAGAYVLSGLYESSVFDAGGMANFQDLTWNGNTPAGTGVGFETRSGNTPAPDGSWSSWQPIGAKSPVLSPDGQFLQYRATLTTPDDSFSPQIDDVSVVYDAGPDTNPPAVVSTDPAHLATGVPVSSNVTINYNEAIDPVTFGATISGGITFTTSFAAGNTTVILDPDTDLAELTAYTVTIAAGVEDLLGNPTTAPYSFDFATVGQEDCWLQTSVADFEGCTLDDVVVTEDDGTGELRLTPSFFDIFGGTSLDPQWESGIYGGGAYAPTVAGGIMTHVNPGGGAFVRTPAEHGLGTTVEGLIKFDRGGNATAGYLYFGFAGEGLVPWALFGTGGNGDQVYATLYDGSQENIPLGADLLETWHVYTIVRTATGAFEWYVDGVLRHTNNTHTIPPDPLRIYFSASGSTPAGSYVAADWMRVDDYPVSPGTFTSCVYSMGSVANWETLVWNGSEPAGTSVGFETRSGDSLVPDGSWSVWEALSGTTILSPDADYIQYRTVLSTGDAGTTPVVTDVEVCYGLVGPDLTPPVVMDTSPAVSATDVPAGTNVAAIFSESLIPATVNGGTFSLTPQGGGPAVAAAVSYDDGTFTATLDPDADLAYDTTYEARLTTGIEDLAGNPMAADHVWSFTTEAEQFCWQETTEAEFADGALTDTEVIAHGDGAVRLTASISFFDHFEGTALGPEWESINFLGNPVEVTVASSAVTVQNATGIKTFATYDHVTLEGLVTIQDGTNAHFGLATAVDAISEGVPDPHWMMFTARNGGYEVRTRMNDGQGDTNGQIDQLVPGYTPGQQYLLKIVWCASDTAKFYIDGNLVASHGRNFGGDQMKIYVTSNLGQDGSADWLRLAGGHATSGTYVSSVHDAGVPGDWLDLTWSGHAVGGTSVGFETRSGDVVVPDPSWSVWEAVAGTSIVSPNNRYVQYRATLSTSDAGASPLIDEVETCFEEVTVDIVPPEVTGTTPTAGAVDVPVSTDVLAFFSEDLDPVTVNGGTFTLTPQGGGPGVTATVSYDAITFTATLDPDADLAYDATYVARLTTGVEDLAGNPLAADHVWAFTTVLTPEGCWLETAVLDFEDGATTGTMITEDDGNGEVRLAAPLNDLFLDPVFDTGTWYGHQGIAGVHDPYTPTIEDGLLKLTAPTATSVRVYSQATFGPGEVFEARANIGIGSGSDRYVSMGLVEDENSNGEWEERAIFSTNANSTRLYVKTRDPDPEPDHNELIRIDDHPGIVYPLDRFAIYRIERDLGEVRFYVDGVNVATVATGPDVDSPMQAVVQNRPADTDSVFVDWVRVTPYAGSPGTYESSVYTSGTSNDWQQLTWTGQQPGGTAVALMTRSGDIDPPDGSWSAWEAISGTSIVSPDAMYIQYQATLSTSDTGTSPVVEEVEICYSASGCGDPPAAVTDLAADQVRSGNPPGQTCGVTLAWPDAGSGNTVSLYRHPFGNYPEYDDPPSPGGEPAIPTDPDDAIANGWTLAAESSGTETVDQPASRDFWYYVAFVTDECDNVSGPSNMVGSVNYFLGDVTGGAGPGEGNNSVDIADITVLGAHYGTSSGHAAYEAFLDVGPTLDGTVQARPTTDDVIDFEDLFFFALNYRDVSKQQAPPPSPAPANLLSLSVPHLPAIGESFQITMQMAGDGQIQGLSVPVRWNEQVLRLENVSAGGLLTAQGGQSVVLSGTPGVVDAVLLGVRRQGISGAGELARLTFRVMSLGNHDFALGDLIARDRRNEAVVLDGEVTVDVPRVTKLHPNVPNPFNPQTTLYFDLSRSGRVSLNIYALDGRLVRRLVKESYPAGRHMAVWDGKNDAGRQMASGVYIYRLVAPGGTQARKMMLIK